MIATVGKAISKLSKTTPLNFKNFSQQEWIMNGVFNLLNFQTVDLDDKEETDPEIIKQKDQIVKDNDHKVEIVKAGIESLIEIARLNYKDMGHWLDKLFEHTKQLMGYYVSREPVHIGNFVIEIWNQILEEEIELAKNIAVQQYDIIRTYNWKELAKLFFEGLRYTGFEESDHTIEDEDEQSISLSCSIALQLLTQVVKDEMVEVAFSYAEQIFTQ